MYSAQFTGIWQPVNLNFHQHLWAQSPDSCILDLLPSRNPIGKILRTPLSRIEWFQMTKKLRFSTMQSHKKFTQRIMHIMQFNLWHRCQKSMSKQISTSCFIIIASQQKLVTLNSRMNSANKAICQAEVINMYQTVQLHCLSRDCPKTDTRHLKCCL